uniref:Uncharacterized protein n=1 Tax=Dendroctonus ponderosae TaxID=77166 RepID=J3JTP3_DENPD|nr:unknown [Dendroctonus ponderosae]
MYDNFSGDFEAFSNSWWPYFIAMFIGIISAIRFYVGGAQCPKSHRMDGKIVIITGGASGLGFETAKNLAARGAHVVLAVRNEERGKRAQKELKKLYTNASIDVKLLDISSVASIRSFAHDIQTSYPKVDVLINNAAVIYQPFIKTPEGNELTLATNYLGPFLLTHLLLPLLNKSLNGRIINVSAMAHYSGKLRLDDLNMEKDYNEKDAFSQSKLALTIFTKYLATLLDNTRIHCNSVSPGLVRGTNHLENLPLQRSLWTKVSVWPWMWLFLKNPIQGCQSIVYLAVEPNLSNISGYYFSDCEIKEPADPVKDATLAQALYDRTSDMVNIAGRRIIEELKAKESQHAVNESGDNEDNF